MEIKQIHSPRLRFAMAPVANPKSFCLDIKKTGEVEDRFHEFQRFEFKHVMWPMDVHLTHGSKPKRPNTRDIMFNQFNLARCYEHFGSWS